jgi:outer membrane lipopolysaccharide assembly protein LptE/RlpB
MIDDVSAYSELRRALLRELADATAQLVDAASRRDDLLLLIRQADQDEADDRLERARERLEQHWFTRTGERR